MAIFLGIDHFQVFLGVPFKIDYFLGLSKFSVFFFFFFFFLGGGGGGGGGSAL